MTASIIIWAPQGSGLGDDMIEMLRKHFGLTRLFDRECHRHEPVDLPANNHLIIARTDRAPLTKIRTISFANAVKLWRSGAQDLPDQIRRPGIQQLVQRIQHQHPTWKPHRCLIEAKVLWSNKRMDGGAA